MNPENLHSSHVGLLAILLLVLASLASARKSVHQASSYCTLLSEETLSCDFQNIDEPVQFDKLDSEVGRKVKNVYIKNVNKLAVSGTPCVNMHLDSITEATFILAHICHDYDDLSMTVMNSKINIVPKYITHLHMEDTAADWLTGDKGFQSLSVLNSSIKKLDINKPIGENVIARFESCRIDVLQELRVENQGRLLMVNTTIIKFKANSMSLANAPATITLSHIKNAEEKAIELKEKGTLVLDRNIGVVTLTGPKGPDMRTPPPQEINVRRPRHPTPTSPLAWIIPTVIATIEAMIIMVNCTNWFPGLKSHPRQRTVEDGSKGTNPGIGLSQSAIYYGSEEYQTTVNKRR